MEFLAVALDQLLGIEVEHLEFAAGRNAQAHFRAERGDPARPAGSDGNGDALVEDILDRPQHPSGLALGEDHLARRRPGAVEDRPHQEAGAVDEAGEPVPVGVDIVQRTGRHAAVHRRFRHGRGDGAEQPRIERSGQQVVAAELQPLFAIGASDLVGDARARQFRQRRDAGEFHVAIDAGRPGIERAAEDERKAQDVVDLVGIVGPAGADHGVRARRAGFFRRDFRVRVGERHDERVRPHAAALVGAQHVRPGKAEKNLRAVDDLVQRAGLAVLRKGGLVRLGLAALANQPVDIQQPDIFALQPQVQQHVQASDARRAAACRNQLDPPEFLAEQMHGVDDGGGDHDGGAVLVVVKDGDIHLRLQPPLDGEAVRRLDVLQVDRAECRFEPPDRIGQGVRIAFVDLDVEYVDIGELLEQDGLAFHNRLRRQRADIAETEHGRAVGHDRDQIGPHRVARRIARPFGDCRRRLGHARRIGQC